MNYPLTEEQRFPLMSDAGRRMLRRLQEHPHAPRYNHRCGDRLDAAAVARVRQFEADLQSGRTGWSWSQLPPWLIEFAARCLREVPYYRRYGGSADDFIDLPTVTRGDLGREPWAFVPDSENLDDLILYTTSGTTGHALEILCHPETNAMYLPHVQLALDMVGVTLEGGPEHVSIVLLCHQQMTFTFASISSYLNEAGFCKVNLYPTEWRDPEDPVRFLDWCNPEIYTGDPVAFAALAQLPLTTRPKAMVSSAQAMRPGLKRQLEERFGCPVIDLYSLNECGIVAVATPRGHEIIPHDLYVEILHPDDAPCQPGERGEVVVSGGRNPFLPLLRYRTGDWASMDYSGAMPVLVGLEGRPPTIFRGMAGQRINNIDVTWVLRDFAMPQYALHQSADGRLTLQVGCTSYPEPDLRKALLGLFGEGQELRVERLAEESLRNGKVVQYTSDVSWPD